MPAKARLSTGHSHTVLPARCKAVVLLFTGLCLAVPATALETRTADGDSGRVHVAADETIDDTLFAAAEAVTIDGVVTGNLMAFARRVTINGTVKGDLITGAEQVEIAGSVEGNVLAFGREIELEGEVSQSVHTFSEFVDLEESATVRGDAFLFASRARIKGSVARDARTYTGNSELTGTVGGDLVARTGRLSLESRARVDGDLTAHVGKTEAVRIDPGAVVGGKTTTNLPEPKPATKAKAKPSRFAQPGFYIGHLWALAAAFLTGLFLHWLLPGLFLSGVDTGGAVLRTLGWGFVTGVVTPVAALLAMLTLVGLPIGLLVAACYAAAMYAAQILIAPWLGYFVIEKLRLGSRGFALSLIVGLVVLLLISGIPFLGAWTGLVAQSLGFGALFYYVRGRLRSAPEVTLAA